MDINIVGRNVSISDRFHTYASQKLDKLATLADRAIAIDVKVTRTNGKNGSAADDRVEITLVGPGPLVRAEAGAGDKFSAFDAALDKLLERVRRAKSKRKVSHGQRRPASLSEVAADGFAAIDITPVDAAVLTGTAVAEEAEDEQDDEEYSPIVIRRKVFEAETITVDDALYRMELVGHDFYLFIDAETDRPSVVYRRKGWDYGVIGLEAGSPQ